jgi:hypothetical protein
MLDEAYESGFEELTLVEPSKYRLELDANPTKNDGVFVKGRVQAGPYEGKLVSCGSLNFSTSAKKGARGIAVRNLKALGISRENCNQILAANNGNWTEFCKVIAAWVKGRIADVELVYNEFNNEVRNQMDPGKATLVSAPPTPGLGSGVPSGAAPAPAPAPSPQAVAGAEVPAPAQTAPAPAPALTPEPVAAAVPSDDPGF